MAAKKKVAKRDPNVPIAAWVAGGIEYEIRYTGPGEYCRAQYNPKHSWGGKTPSLIITERGSMLGTKDHEVDPYSPSTWGWLVRLITDGTIDRAGWKAVTKTDEQLNREEILANMPDSERAKL